MSSDNSSLGHLVFGYFNYDRETNKSNCKIKDCKFPSMHGKHVSNLVQHLKRRHPDASTEFLQKRKKLLCDKGHVNRTSDTDTVVNVKISRKAFIAGCLKFVILDGRPFSIFNDDGFQLIASPILQEFERINKPIPISANYIQDIARNVQTDVMNRIKSEMRGKLVSLQLDLTNHFQRCILGLNVQYYVGDELVLRVLAMRRLNVSTSALNIAIAVRNILEEYGLDVDHIYTVTTDNGANVILCTQILQLMQERSTEINLLSQNADNINEEQINAFIDIESDRILQNQALQFLHIVRCSTHTLQIVMGDTLKTEPTKGIVGTCREVVKKLRTPTIVNLLNSKNLKLAKIDIDIRWSSVYDMVSV